MNTTIHTNELKSLMELDPTVQLLDVRSAAEFESVHIPGAFNIPLDVLGDVSAEVAAADGLVVLVCQSGNRACKAEVELVSAGKNNVAVLDGGMAAWETAGGKISRGTQRWAMDRQVRGVAGLMILVAVLTAIAVPAVVWIAAFVGAGLAYSAVTNSCGMAAVLSKLPYNQASGTSVDVAVAELTRV